MPDQLAVIPVELAQEAIALLQAGRPLPDDFRLALFENKREYELSYAEKQREADVLAETMAVPLQPVRTFGSAENGWSNILVLGDNLQVLKTLLQMKLEGQLRNADGSLGVRLCYIDPPFASRREFLGTKQQPAYEDKVVGAQFIEFLRKRLILIRELLSDDGSIYVHLDERKSSYIKVVMDEIFGENNFEREIVWRIGWVSGYKTTAKNWIRNHDTILYYTRGRGKVFNKEYLTYPEDYERRGGGKPTGQGIPIEDTWNCNSADRLDSIQIMSFTAEKTGFPTQKNKNLVARMIKASSNPGDLVLDAFCGSGTTCVVAEELGRYWIGIDSSKLAIYISQERLLRNGADRKTLRQAQPFTLYNAGLYDYQLLKKLPWQDFRSFALRLFQCRDEAHRVGRLQLDGYLGVDHVLVFDFRENPDALLDEVFINDLHQVLGDKIGRRFFLIAPAASVSFMQDYIEFPGDRHTVRYFVLRIPYSVIEEIHQRGFTRLQQPVSESSINETVDAVGFDFIQPPHVECRFSKTFGKYDIQITEFESEGMTRNGDRPSGFDALSMVMVDLSYDDEIFDVQEVFYAEELQRAGFAFSLPEASVGRKMMFIYVDVYGNEYREVKTPKDFVSVTAT